MLVQHMKQPPATSHPTNVPSYVEEEEIVEMRRAGIVLRIGTALDAGIARALSPNEDTLSVTHGCIGSAISKQYALLNVADGMGGHGHGQEASRLAVQSLVEYVSGVLCSRQVMPQTLLRLLEEGVRHANEVVFRRNQEQGTVMGTTMTASLIVDTCAYVVHVGDSRCYLFRQPAGLSQITHDHSLVAALVAAGIIQPEDIYTHPRRNLIYRCLGEKASVEVESCVVPLAADDLLLFCSDGLWEMVRDQQITTILTASESGPTQTAQALLQAALAGGGEDNVSVLVVRVDPL
jgi:PPM family protein phosphatase